MSDGQLVVLVGGFMVGTIAFVVNLIAVIIAVYKMGRAVEKFENIGTQQAHEIAELKIAVTTVSKLITETSLQSQRLDMIEERMGQQYRLIEEMRRGEGFILPPSVSAHEVRPRQRATDEDR